MTVQVVYDQALFLTEDEYSAAKGKVTRNVQQLVEEPEIYIVALSSSSPTDQLAIIPDRLDDLKELSQDVSTSSGIEVHDTVRYFIGDHPAQQFERGMKQGGTYKCGGCGCPDVRMDDFAHASQCEWCSLAKLQALVLAGKHGNKAGVLKAFEGLRVSEIREELMARGNWEVDKNKKELDVVLSSILRGAQRVPSLLITDPHQSLDDLNLSDYVVADCEPLHDLKGHLQHLLTELLHGHPEDVCKDLLEHVLFSRKEGGYTGTDLRVALLEVHKLLHSLDDVDAIVKLLIQTAAQISQILYASEEKRTPKAVLQLYNCTWVHHELCLKLFPHPSKCTRQALFGIYLHALIVHAPVLYEVVCLRSLNTENQERIFQQVKQIAKSVTNRQPSNIIPTLLLRLQARQLTGDLSSSLQCGESRVKQAALAVPNFSGTVITDDFLESRSSSWQAHLERISSFLLCGEGVWWEKVSSGYKFFDGDDDAEFRQQGTPLLHFRSTSLCEVQVARKDGWEKLIRDGVTIPARSTRVFDEQGSLLERRELCMSEAATPAREPRSLVTTSTPAVGAHSVAVLDLSGIDTHDNHVTSDFPQAEPSLEGNENQVTSEAGTEKHEAQAILEFNDDVGCVENQAVLQTKLGSPIQRALGDSQALLQFDRLHHKLKTKRQMLKKLSRDEIQRHQHMMTHLHSCLVDKKKELSELTKQYEHKHFNHHGQLPIDSVEYTSLLRKLGYVKKLLHTWEMPF